MTTPELSPDVRTKAAQAAYERTAISPYPGWNDLKEEWREQMHREVDAVTAVVAGEIKRQLRTENEELRLRLHAQHAANAEFMRGQADEFAVERVAFQARITELEDELGEARVEIQSAEAAVDGAGVVVLVKEHRVRGEEVVRLRARAELLTTALTRLVDDGDSAAWDNARVVLAAGATDRD